MGWHLIFESFGDGAASELSVPSFIKVSREVLNLPAAVLSDPELRELHGVVDTDENVLVDAGELIEFLTMELEEHRLNFEAFYSSIFELATVWAESMTEQGYTLFLEHIFNSVAE